MGFPSEKPEGVLVAGIAELQRSTVKVVVAGRGTVGVSETISGKLNRTVKLSRTGSACLRLYYS